MYQISEVYEKNNELWLDKVWSGMLGSKSINKIYLIKNSKKNDYTFTILLKYIYKKNSKNKSC
jgi:hypothetical protein